MLAIRVVAIPTDVAELVRATMQSPTYSTIAAHHEIGISRLLAATASARLPPESAESYLPMIASQASSRCPCRARCSFMPTPANATRKALYSPKSFVRAREPLKPTPEAAAFLRRNM